jgi:cell division septum initiation protein DivIVA
VTITSESISGKRFATVRKDGYDTSEVDQCVVDLERALNDAERKRSVLEEANGLLHDQLIRSQDDRRLADEECARLREELAAASEAGDDPVRSSSQSAVRLLEIAAREADALVETARAQAGELLTEARAEAEAVVRMAREEADRQRGQAERRCTEVEARVAELTAFEEAYRAGLVSHIETHREALCGPTVQETVAVAVEADSVGTD